MKAADFALLLLTRAEQSSLTSGQRIVILAVTAGLHTPADVSRWTNLTPAAAAQILARLHQLKFLLLTDPNTSHYSLSKDGEAWVSDFLSFVKKH